MPNPQLARNLDSIRQRIGAAARGAGRDPGGVSLVVVTKAAPPAVFPLLAELGVRDVGENRVQALVSRRDSYGPGFRWHLIGHLQRNKVPEAIRASDFIHSVDSLRLAERIEDAAKSEGRAVEVLAQVNVSGEGTKSGMPPAEVGAFLDSTTRFPHLRVRGLMTMAPLVEDPERTRPIFRSLAEISRTERDRLGGDSLGPELSMGMTQDFEVAIAEGATLVRIGTAIFEGVELS